MTRHRFAYPARLDGDGPIQVRFRDIPEALTGGDGRADALWQAGDCLEEAVAAYIASGRDIPAPSRRGKGEVLVPLPPVMAAKAALHQTLKEAGLSKAALAGRLGCEHKEVRRMLDPKHPTKIPALHRALAVLGKAIVLEVRDAA